MLIFILICIGRLVAPGQRLAGDEAARALAGAEGLHCSP
jgi:hypothetical protein